MGKFSRDKGKRGEREVVRELNQWFDALNYKRLRAQRVLTESRAGRCDIELVAPEGDLGVAIQVKNCAKNHGYWMRKAYLEAEQMNPNDLPVGIVKMNGQWVAVMGLELAAEALMKHYSFEMEPSDDS